MIAESAALLIIVVGALLPGVLALLHWRKPWDADGLEFLFAALSLGFSVFGWLALLQAEVGRFSMGWLGGAWLVSLLGLVGLVGRQGHWKLAQRFKGMHRWESLGLGLWVIIAAWLFFRPHEFIVGGADAGVYVSLGANIARTGSILIHEPALAALDPALYPALLRALPAYEAAPYYLAPGFYVPGQPPGLIIPQFYPLHPVWLAVGYALGGLRAELLLTPLWGMLASLAVYMAVRQWWGYKTGLLALAGLTLNAIQVWFVRYPTTEALTQYLTWSGLWGFTAWLSGRKPAWLWGLLAGLAWGQVFLTRIDMYFLLAIPAAAWLWLRLTGRWRSEHTWFFAPVLILAGHSLLHAVSQSGPYFFNTFRYGAWLLEQNWLALIIAAASSGGMILSVAAWRYMKARRGDCSVQNPHQPDKRLERYRRPALMAGIGLIVLLAVYAWFIRPHVGGPVVTSPYWYGGGEIPALDRENLVRLGWYLAPPGIWLAVAGMGLLMWQWDRRTAALLGVGLFFSLLYLWRIQANPHQIYAMRRYVPVVMPFFIVTAAYLLGWLYERRHAALKWSGPVLAALWLGGLAWSARGLVSQVDYHGLTPQIEQFNAALGPRSVLIFNDPAPVGLGDLVGTPLQFLYGHAAFTLRNPDMLDTACFKQTIQNWQADGYRVYWVSMPGGYEWPGQAADLIPLDRYRLSSVALEGTYTHKPYALIEVSWAFSLASVQEAWP